ncbi:hypothetical protein NUACC21_78390 [Scytonema sp. NUACC21]
MQGINDQLLTTKNFSSSSGDYGNSFEINSSIDDDIDSLYHPSLIKLGLQYLLC